jgi:hypothetical protein
MKDLTMWQTVLQSQAIHPDWDAETHLAYLDQEAYPVSTLGQAAGRTPKEVVERWLRENADAGRPETLRMEAGL